MTNKDKFLKDGVSVEEFAEELTHFYHTEVEEVNISIKENLYYATKDFFEAEIKPHLTEDERVILSNIDKENNYIGRHKDSIFVDAGKLYVSERTEAHGWCNLPCDHLFQFIKERRRIL